MRSIEMLMTIVVFLLLSNVKMTRGCVIYESKFCANITQYYPVPQSLAGSSDFTYEFYDDVIDGLGFSNITLLGPLLFPACYQVMLKYLCGSYFPGCDANNSEILICLDLCNNFVDECSSILESQNLTSLIPNCTSNYNNNPGCTMLDSVPPLNYSGFDCPGFLVPNRYPELNLSSCPGACCIPCPVSYYLYAQGEFATVIYVLLAFNCICTALCFGVGFAYLLIPAKRSYPQSLVTQLSFSVGLILLASWISVYYGPVETVCINDIVEAGPGIDHPPCQAQGVLFFYGLWAACLWFFCICFNIFLIIFFRFDERRFAPWVLPVICWGVPWIPIGFLLREGQIGAGFTPACGIPDVTYANNAVLYPISVVLFPSLLLTIIVSFKVYLLTRNTKKSFRSILKINFRPLVFSFLATSSFVAFWLYYELATVNLTNWLEDWFLCVAFGGTQTECAKIPAPYIPKPGVVVFIYLLLPVVGVVTFLLFGVKKDVWKGLLELFGVRIFEDLTDGYSATASQTHGSKISARDNEEEVTKKDRLGKKISHSNSQVQMEERWQELEKESGNGEERAKEMERLRQKEKERELEKEKEAEREREREREKDKEIEKETETEKELEKKVEMQDLEKQGTKDDLLEEKERDSDD